MNEALPVVIVGAGFAGVAAAWAVAEAGQRALVFSAHAGASELYSGILDGPAPSAELGALASALGLVLSSPARAVATREGMVRRVHGRDAALLDLEAVAGGTIAVADLGRDEWDGELLARSYAASAWARETRTRFRTISVTALRSGAERRISPFDFARALEDPARLEELGRVLSTAATDVDAWLFGPWLGIEAQVAESLSRAAGHPVGETASAPGGAAGARFALRRSSLFVARGIESRNELVRAVDSTPAGAVVTLKNGERIRARAVVLAVGGVASGGILLGSSPVLALSVAAPVRIALDGDVLDGASWLSGPSFQRKGLRALERLGVAADPDLRTGPNSALFVCGDALSAEPRNTFSALASGLAAGRGALATP
jgi:anaerobic glycerol-3-phosphate dehydrogenase